MFIELRNIAHTALLSLLCLLALSSALPAEETDWPESWRFRLRTKVENAAESLDLRFDHDSLIQADGRDLRVFGPDGKPVSHWLSFVGNRQCRMLFDGAPGPGLYAVYFGNLSAELPPPPNGVCAFGRKEWRPNGGYTCVSYNPGHYNYQKIKDEKSLFGTVTEVKTLSDAAARKEAEKQKDPARRRPFHLESRHASSDTRLADRWLHIFRAEVVIPEAAEYELVIEGHRGHFRVLFLDGDLRKAVIPGWYGHGQHTNHLSVWSGKARLSAGRHSMEVYTTLNRPAISMRRTDKGESPITLTGWQARYEAAPVTPGPFETKAGTVGDAACLTIAQWTELGASTRALAACRSATARFADTPSLLNRISDLREKALTSAYERNWLVEGKNLRRTGAVPDAALRPPLAAGYRGVPNMVNNRAWLGNGAWLEGNLFYGLPFNVQETPWGVTSPTTVVEDTLYVGTKNGEMFAVTCSTGIKKWVFPGGGACCGSPLVYRGVLYYGSVDRRLYAIDVERGRMLWNYPTRGFIEGGPCAHEGRVYFGSRDHYLYALDARLGVRRWRTDLRGPIVATPSSDGESVYVGTKTGEFFAVHAATGALQWTYATGASIEGGSCVANGQVSFGDAAGKVHSLDTKTGEPRWAPVDVGGPVVASPILVGPLLYGGTTNRLLWGIHALEGLLGWRRLPGERDHHGGFFRPPVYANGSVFLVARPTSRQTRGAVLSLSAPRGRSRYPCFLRAGDLKLDGDHSEPAWEQAQHLPDLLRPDGLAYPGRTTVAVTWDETNLYLGMTCSDTDLVSGGTERDGELRAGDSLTVLIDPRRDGLAVTSFTVSVSGTQGDAVLLAVSDPESPEKLKRAESLRIEQTGKAWQPEWRAAVKIDGTVRRPGETQARADVGWQVEIAIPWKSFPTQLVQHAPHNGWAWPFNVVVTDAGGKRRPPEVLSLTPATEPAGIGTHARWPELHFQQKTR